LYGIVHATTSLPAWRLIPRPNEPLNRLPQNAITIKAWLWSLEGEVETLLGDSPLLPTNPMAAEKAGRGQG